jgi:Cu/Ag efflux pump CusA
VPRPWQAQFVPLAILAGACAEAQRPLVTVVIGSNRSLPFLTPELPPVLFG